ncbi:MAG: hypothetical protein WBW93_12360 [Steroidobacteraceae bacterium]
MDDEAQELKIAALIDAADAAQARALETIEALNATRAGLQQAVAQAARASTQEALKSLHGELERAQHVVIDLQRLSLWRAAWQHVMVALVAIVVTLVAVWWYVPSVNDMQALRAEKVQLEASIADLEQRGGKLQISHCGPEKRVCVAVDDYAGIYGKDADYRIAKGY